MLKGQNAIKADEKDLEDIMKELARVLPPVVPAKLDSVEASLEKQGSVPVMAAVPAKEGSIPAVPAIHGFVPAVPAKQDSIPESLENQGSDLSYLQYQQRKF